MIMEKIEKRELVEQQRKIFEAGVQRADKRSGSFSFLTWAFFLAPLLASKSFVAAMEKPAAADEHATAAHQSTAPHAANDDPPAMDLAKMSGQNETGFAASSTAHAPQADPIGAAPQLQQRGNDLDSGHQ